MLVLGIKLVPRGAQVNVGLQTVFKKSVHSVRVFIRIFLDCYELLLVVKQKL